MVWCVRYVHFAISIAHGLVPPVGMVDTPVWAILKIAPTGCHDVMPNSLIPISYFPITISQ